MGVFQIQILEVWIHTKNISKTDTLLIQQLKVPMQTGLPGFETGQILDLLT